MCLMICSSCLVLIRRMSEESRTPLEDLLERVYTRSFRPGRVLVVHCCLMVLTWVYLLCYHFCYHVSGVCGTDGRPIARKTKVWECVKLCHCCLPTKLYFSIGSIGLLFTQKF